MVIIARIPCASGMLSDVASTVCPSVIYPVKFKISFRELEQLFSLAYCYFR